MIGDGAEIHPATLPALGCVQRLVHIVLPGFPWHLSVFGSGFVNSGCFRPLPEVTTRDSQLTTTMLLGTAGGHLPGNVFSPCSSSVSSFRVSALQFGEQSGPITLSLIINRNLSTDGLQNQVQQADANIIHQNAVSIMYLSLLYLGLTPLHSPSTSVALILWD